MSLVETLASERSALYARARGGVSAPAAGFLYWGGLALLGKVLPERGWMLAAFFGSGLIFPLAILLQRPLGADVLAKSPLSGAVFAALFSMLIGTWSITITAFLKAPALVPLTLAIGMALHWPVIGWMYGRTVLFSLHLIVRTAAVMAIWLLWPTERFTLLPTAVSAVYFVTAVIILLDVGVVRRRLGITGSGRSQQPGEV
jgi:hypothetical protein